MEVTLEITDYCPNSCDYCSTNAEPIRKNLVEVEEVKKFLSKISEESEIYRINISGEEPLSHPQFYDILLLCEYHTNDEISVVFDTIAYVLNNNGKTIEKLVANYNLK